MHCTESAWHSKSRASPIRSVQALVPEGLTRHHKILGKAAIPRAGGCRQVL